MGKFWRESELAAFITLATKSSYSQAEILLSKYLPAHMCIVYLGWLAIANFYSIPGVT